MGGMVSEPSLSVPCNQNTITHSFVKTHTKTRVAKVCILLHFITFFKYIIVINNQFKPFELKIRVYYN